MSASTVPNAVTVREKIERMESQEQFLTECQKLDPVEEQTLVEDWLNGEQTESPQVSIATAESEKDQPD